MNKRKPSAPQLALPVDSQAMLTWDASGNVEMVSVANQFAPLRAAANDVTMSKTKGGKNA